MYFSIVKWFRNWKYLFVIYENFYFFIRIFINFWFWKVLKIEVGFFLRVIVYFKYIGYVIVGLMFYGKKRFILFWMVFN